jgi:putative resolvase
MNAENTYITAAKIKQTYQICSNTLVKWADADKVRHRRMPGGKRLYNAADIEHTFNSDKQFQPVPLKSRHTVCYARVSSEHQKSDLQRQIEDLQSSYPGTEIISDVGSGLNWKRKGLLALLERVYQGDVETVVVRHRDRLCRFGSELILWIFSKTDTKLVVHSKNPESETTADANCKTELVDDLLSIVTVFVARNNGQRSANNRKERRAKQMQENQNISGQVDDQ